MTETEQRALILRERYDLTVPERALIERGLLLADSLGKKEYLPPFLISKFFLKKKYTSPILMAKFVLIPAGTFMMGSPADEPERDNDETLHQVTISKPFYLQTNPVTQGQWKKVMGNNPSYFEGDDNLPVESVSWDDVQKFIRKLNKMEGSDKYLLPTEAEWEYACRAGSKTTYCFGNDPGRLGAYAWYCDNSGNVTHPIRLKKPNAWGLYDIHGNVWEWCQDWYCDYPSNNVTDPDGPSSGSYRVFRGGSWIHRASYCRSADRFFDNPGVHDDRLGFRLVALSSHREIESVEITAIERLRVKKLIALGEERGFLTYDDVNDLLPDDIILSNQIDDVIMFFGKKNIDIIATDKSEKMIIKKPTMDDQAD